MSPYLTPFSELWSTFHTRLERYRRDPQYAAMLSFFFEMDKFLSEYYARNKERYAQGLTRDEESAVTSEVNQRFILYVKKYYNLDKPPY